MLVNLCSSPSISLDGMLWLKHRPADAFFFKFIILSWKILCVISQSTYFAVSYSGRLDRMLDRIQLSDACATYSRKIATIYTSISWVMVIMIVVFTAYSMFFTDGYMDIMLAPITTHIYLSDLLIPRVVMFLLHVYFSAACCFPHAMTFMLAKMFSYQYKVLSRSLDTMLAESDERRLSDSDIETLRQRHQEISMSVSDTDDFLMFHNAGAFCCTLFQSILLLYELIFYRAMNDSVILIMRVCWTLGVFCGLTVTTAGGIMVNHYVSTNAVILGIFSVKFKIHGNLGIDIELPVSSS